MNVIWGLADPGTKWHPGTFIKKITYFYFPKENKGKAIGCLLKLAPRPYFCTRSPAAGGPWVEMHPAGSLIKKQYFRKCAVSRQARLDLIAPAKCLLDAKADIEKCGPGSLTPLAIAAGGDFAELSYFNKLNLNLHRRLPNEEPADLGECVLLLI